MTLEGISSLAIIMFVLCMIIALAVSYLYGWKMIEWTGWFGSQTFIASVINLFLGACSMFGWFLYAFGIDEALFFGGLALGGALLVVSESVLIITLYVRRDKLVEAYHEQADSVSEQE
ncbi:hypothetical protein SAMN04488072_10476 [Lentibacillus halodurans]|uniref:Uncharacterized protein n=1 Tax=Lentibacillus halodurans TaxID=237679 RepID=A0A1I0X2I8_9BACI|nr:hypothetical protein [Lentibacillus halodurans]SFA94630.1 hypothetical protein SAMN04488072_10476 [Lentibacillus halodurans]